MPSGDVQNPASLYPQAPAPAQGGLASMNPLQIVGLASGVQQYQNNQSIMQARQATGEAFQGALNDDGSIDQTKLATALRDNPAAAYTLPETTDRTLAQTQGQFNLDAKRNQFLVDGLGSLADDPDLNMDKTRSTMVTLARNLKIPGSQVNNILDSLPTNTDALRGQLNRMRNVAIGSAGSSTPIETTDDTGATRKIPTSTFNYRGSAGVPSGLPTGEATVMESAAKRAAVLQGTADTSPQYRADLENLRSDSKILDNLSGPTFDVEKKLNSLSSRVAGFGITMTPEQLKAGDSFDKIANQISLRQGAAFGGTDAARSMSLGATPNTSMSKLGREAVIDMALGNQDMVDKARDAWLSARSSKESGGQKITAADYDLFMHGIGKQMDARVFQFNRLSRPNQQKFLSNMPPSEVPDFENNYRAAIHRGWVKELK